MREGAPAEPACDDTHRELTTRDLDYGLDQSLIAQRPRPEREEARALVIHREDGRLVDSEVRRTPELFERGDVLVLNQTRVFPARLLGRKPTGASAEVLLVTPLDARCERWRALVRPGGKLKPGRRVEVSELLTVEIEETLPGGARRVRLVTELSPMEAIRRVGHVPLPPYIRRPDDVRDRERYQTVYAKETGSIAAPTAGLHFTRRLLDEIRARGVEIAVLTLHVGPGTFRPIEAADPSDHTLDAEWYRLPEGAADRINRGRGTGGAVWAVGTTVVRTLETVADESGIVHPGEGWTDLYIRPGFRFRTTDHLITNFHLPRSSLLLLVIAFAGYDLTMTAYRHAMARGYRFYSYGDATVVL